MEGAALREMERKEVRAMRRKYEKETADRMRKAVRERKKSRKCNGNSSSTSSRVAASRGKRRQRQQARKHTQQRLEGYW